MGLINAARDLRTIRRLLTRAEAEARTCGEEAHGPEHLLLAAASLPDRTAVRALARVGVDPEQLRDAIETAQNSAPALRDPATGVMRSTPQAQHVFREAVALSKSTKPSRLRGAHVVAATCALQHGTAVRALAALNVDRERLRAAACAEVGID